jgi:hypothetical protein
MAERLKHNAMYSIPDDLEYRTYPFIIIASKRARQLQNVRVRFWQPLL